MGIITLDLGLYGATVVLFHIISVVYLWLGVVVQTGPKVVRVLLVDGRAPGRQSRRSRPDFACPASPVVRGSRSSVAARGVVAFAP